MNRGKKDEVGETKSQSMIEWHQIYFPREKLCIAIASYITKPIVYEWEQSKAESSRVVSKISIWYKSDTRRIKYSKCFKISSRVVYIQQQHEFDKWPFGYKLPSTHTTSISTNILDCLFCLVSTCQWNPETFAIVEILFHYKCFNAHMGHQVQWKQEQQQIN